MLPVHAFGLDLAGLMYVATDVDYFLQTLSPFLTWCRKKGFLQTPVGGWGVNAICSPPRSPSQSLSNSLSRAMSLQV